MLFIPLFGLINFANASEVVISSSTTYVSTANELTSNYKTAGFAVMGESFTIGTAYYLTGEMFYLAKAAGSPTGTMYAVLCIYNSSVTPNGYDIDKPVAISTDTLDVSTIGAGAWYRWNFNGTYQFNTSASYVCAFYSVGGTLNAGNKLGIGYSGSTVGGEMFWESTGDNFFDGHSSNDNMYQVLGSLTGTPTPSPSPSPTPVATSRYGWTITPNVTFNLYSWGLTSNLVQGQGYTYTGNIISNSTPYGDGNYSYYTTGLKNNLNDAVTDLLAKTVNFNATGTYNINYAGTFSFSITPYYTQGSGYTYQGYLVNGTIRQTGETFESITVIVASEPTKDIRIYLSGGTFTNYELLTTVNFNQVNFGVTYTANGRLFLGSLLTGNYTYYLATTILTSSQLTAKNELFTNVSYGNVQNGIFQFVIAPRTYSSFPLYQGLQITINGTQKTFWLEFIGTVNGLFSSNPATPNPNEFGGGMSAQMIEWLIMMFLMFIPVIGATVAIAMLTHSGSATALVFFGAGLIDVIIGVLIGFIDWWVIIIFGVFLIIAAYAQFGKVTSGG